MRCSVDSMASTPLPVHLPASARNSSRSSGSTVPLGSVRHSGATLPASSSSASATNENLRLSIPSTPAQHGAVSSVRSNASHMPQTGRYASQTQEDAAEFKNGVPPPSQPQTAYSSVASTPQAAAMSVRTSYGSLPPTRVGSPRVSGAGLEEEDEFAQASPSNNMMPQQSPSSVQQPQQQQQQALRIAHPSPSPSPASGSHHPASRAGVGLTPSQSRPPIPLGRHDKKSSAAGKFAACFKPTLAPSSIFGVQLITLVDTFKRLPAFLDRSIEYLCQHLDESDHFFTALPEARLQELVNYLEDAGEGECSIRSIEYYGVTAVGAFLKRFLDQLPDPLLTYVRYHQFCSAAHFTPVGSSAVASGLASPHSPSPQVRVSFPAMAVGDVHDQAMLIQALVVGLPGAHYLLLERVIDLLQRIVQNNARHDVPVNVSLTRLSSIFCSSLLEPLFAPSHAQAKHEASIQRAMEQQCLTYLIQHHQQIFQTNPIRELALLSRQPPSTVIDPNPGLQTAVQQWRRVAGGLKLNFSQRHFALKTLLRAFRGWKAQSKTNRRKAEAYRQLALLKAELLAERQKNISLTRELYGLKEEYELRDFQDQLRLQTSSLGGSGGYGSTRSGLPALPVGASVAGKYGQDEKEAYSGGGMGGGGAAPRDLSADLAAVRALQNQDRQLTSTYARY
jgi:hypothetical protein